MLKIAMIYDFDQTLCTTNMQEYSLLPALNIEAGQFWKDVGELSKRENMDSILAYMYMLIRKGWENNTPITKEFFHGFGNSIIYYPGVEEFFDRINRYGEEKGIQIQHYIISSGTSEIIEETSIAHHFTKIFASRFHYDEEGFADWPALAINYTGKTQFLFRINKNSLDIYDNTKINLASATRDIPLNRMIYIADGITDVPCMRVVKDNGGYSVAVYDEKSEKTSEQLIHDNRVNYVAPADYRPDSQLDRTIKAIIDRIAVEEKLREYTVTNSILK